MSKPAVLFTLDVAIQINKPYEDEVKRLILECRDALNELEEGCAHAFDDFHDPYEPPDSAHDAFMASLTPEQFELLEAPRHESTRRELT